MIETRGYDANVPLRLRAADTHAAAGDQFTFATIRQREQDHVFAMTMARQLTGTKLAVFQLDAIPRSSPLAHYRQGLIGVVHSSESNGTPRGSRVSAESFANCLTCAFESAHVAVELERPVGAQFE